MFIVDSHTHLYAPQFDTDRAAMLARARAAGVGRFLMPNIDSSSIQPMLAVEAEHPDCTAMMGLHPTSVQANYREELAIVEQYLGQRSWIAVGEIGIDLYWDQSHFAEQREAFLLQSRWARELEVPIVIHSRESTGILLDLLAGMPERERPTGVFHCFTGSVAEAELAIDLGFYLGIGGVVTFKNGGLDRTVAELPLDRLLVETDAPYLAPVPYRGKRNESAYVRQVVDRLATIYGTTVEAIAQATTHNAERLFKLTSDKQ